jgi:hypothetical protein
MLPWAVRLWLEEFPPPSSCHLPAVISEYKDLKKFMILFTPKPNNLYGKTF